MGLLVNACFLGGQFHLTQWLQPDAPECLSVLTHGGQVQGVLVPSLQMRTLGPRGNKNTPQGPSAGQWPGGH